MVEGREMLLKPRTEKKNSAHKIQHPIREPKEKFNTQFMNKKRHLESAKGHPLKLQEGEPKIFMWEGEEEHAQRQWAHK